MNLGIVQELSLGQAKDLERLLLGDKATFDPQPFLRYLLATNVCIFFTEGLVILLFEVAFNL